MRVMAAKAREQRRYTRVPFREQAHVVEEGDVAGQVGETRDISLGGVFIEGIAGTFGHKVVVHLHPTGAFEAVRLPGIVRWVSAEGVGVQFSLLGARETHFLTDILASSSSS